MKLINIPISIGVVAILLRSLMEHNKLGPTDDAYLSKDTPIYLVHKAE